MTIKFIPPDPPKRKITEIVLRLTLEPQIRELYVEGLFDRDLYREALSALGLGDVKVYPIETVEVPNELLIDLKLTKGNRQRVQAAAMEFENLQKIHGQVIFLIDADLDYILDAPGPVPPLERTDGTAAEVMMWNKQILERFFRLALARQDPMKDVIEIMSSVEKIACESFLFRAAREMVAKEWKSIEVTDSFSAKEVFCLDKHCERAASKNAGHKIMTNEIRPMIKKLSIKALDLPIEKKVHGHELIAIFAQIMRIKGFKNKCIEDSDELGRLMMSSLDWGGLGVDKTLQRIKDKFQAGAKIG